jgi:hypothetical protein
VDDKSTPFYYLHNYTCILISLLLMCLLHQCLRIHNHYFLLLVSRFIYLFLIFSFKALRNVNQSKTSKSTNEYTFALIDAF